jgi:hypothetical protein
MPRVRVLCALLVCALFGATAGSASAATVRVGSAPRTPAGATVGGALPGSTTLKLTIALEPRDPAALAAYASSVADPGSADYHQYLSVAQFAARFGATPAAIAAVRSSLQADGLTPGAATANGLSIPVTTTASGAVRAFSTSFHRVTLRGGAAAYANTTAPALASGIAGDVQGVVGLDDLARARPLDLTRQRATAHATSAAARANAAFGHVETHTSAVTPCTAASQYATAYTSYTADQIADIYDFGSLYAAGDEGAGETVAVYELESNFPSDVTTYEDCFGATGTVSYQAVDGGAGTPVETSTEQDGTETELDTENVLGLAPKANLIVYQGPNTDQGGLDVYSAIITADSAKVITTSWGECEALLGKSTANAEATLFEEAAAQGQTIVSASGDDGVDDCDGGADGSTVDTTPAVDDPASQPFVTGVGGTSLGDPPPAGPEVVWNDPTTPDNSLDPDGTGASGGGNSSFWTMPGYQSSAASSLNVINGESSPASCGAASGTYCREVPDVSASADPTYGYVIYFDGSWESLGGTSGAAPVWAALFALADDSTACSSPIGFANPTLYAAASSAYASDFTDITSGNNDWLGTNGAEFAAGTGYDQASGLGSPLASSLAGTLCGEARLTINTPATQTTVVGGSASLQLSTSASSGVTWSASNLPAGLTLNGATGLISGKPTAAGTESVAIAAVDGDDRVAGTHFNWTIAPSTITLTHPAAQEGQLGRADSLRLHATNSATALVTYAAADLPPGLTLSPTTGLISGTPRTAGHYTTAVAAGATNAASAATTIAWTIGRRPTLTNSSLSGVAKQRATLSFRVTAGKDAAELKKVMLRLPSGLSFAHRATIGRYVSVRSLSGGKLRFTASLSGGRLTITLRSAATRAVVKLSSPGITANARLKRTARKRRPGKVAFDVTVADADALSTALSVKITP